MVYTKTLLAAAAMAATALADYDYPDVKATPSTTKYEKPATTNVWAGYTTTPALNCDPWTEEYECDGEDGMPYTTIYTVYSKGCPSYTEWSGYPVHTTTPKAKDPAVWGTYTTTKSADPAVWGTYTTTKSKKPMPPKPTDEVSWEEFEDWEHDGKCYKKADGKYYEVGPDGKYWDEQEGKYCCGVKPVTWGPEQCYDLKNMKWVDVGKDGKYWNNNEGKYCCGPAPSAWETYDECYDLKTKKYVAVGKDGQYWNEEEGKFCCGVKPVEWVEADQCYDLEYKKYVPVGKEGKYWNEEENKYCCGWKPEPKKVVTITITETYKTPCPTGWAEATTVIYTTHCGCTETPVPTKPAYSTYTTTCPASWGVGPTVTVTVPYGMATTPAYASTWSTYPVTSVYPASTWSAYPVTSVYPTSTWATYAAPTSTGTWSAYSTPVKASSTGVWSPVGTYAGSAASFGANKAMVALAGGAAGLAFLL